MDLVAVFKNLVVGWPGVWYLLQEKDQAVHGLNQRFVLIEGIDDLQELFFGAIQDFRTAGASGQEYDQSEKQPGSRACLINNDLVEGIV